MHGKLLQNFVFFFLDILQESKRTSEELCGRTDGNVKVIFPKTDLRVQPEKLQVVPIKPGDYVLVKVCYVLIVLSPILE